MTQNLLRQRQEQIETVAALLIPGEYRFDRELRIFYHSQFEQDLLLKNRQLDRTLDSIVIESSQVEAPIYHAIWFGINGDLKLFSEDQVLTVGVSQENFDRKLANRRTFRNYFSMPELLTIDNQHLRTTEERLFGEIPGKADMLFVFNIIGQDYLNYFQQADTSEMTINQLLATSPNAVYQPEFQWLINLIPSELLAQPWPQLPVHGDLWTENMLIVGNQQLYYLDWDEDAPHIFFFDFFKLLWNELDVHQAKNYLQDYLAGYFDELLEAWFACFGLTYEKEQRQTYLHLFFLDFLLRDTPNYLYLGKRYELLDYQKKVMPYFD